MYGLLVKLFHGDAVPGSEACWEHEHHRELQGRGFRVRVIKFSHDPLARACEREREREREREIERERDRERESESERERERGVYSPTFLLSFSYSPTLLPGS